MSQPHSTLFSAIVLSGIALTGGSVACGSETSEPSTQADAGGGATGDAAAASDSDASGTVADGGDMVADAGDGGCPPGSERPVPPCDLIK